MFYAYLKRGTSKFYFTGSGFDNIPFKMKKYKTLSSLRQAVKPFLSKIPTGYALYSDKVKAQNRRKKRLAPGRARVKKKIIKSQRKNGRK